jgi:hypothetical protein
MLTQAPGERRAAAVGKCQRGRLGAARRAGQRRLQPGMGRGAEDRLKLRQCGARLAREEAQCRSVRECDA